MGFERRSTATKYQAQDGDTLAKIAERETAAGNAITAEDIARFNWGTDDPEVIDEHLRDELGCYKRGDDNHFVISADGEPRSDLLIPTPFKRVGLAVDKEHTLRVKKQPAPAKQFEGCEKVSGVTFEFDKSFVRPSVVGDLKKVEAELAKHPEAKVLIFGHTDKVGSESYNKQLSERRALSVYAFITNQPEIWEDLYKEEGWGIRSVQEILKDMGGPYDPGPVDGIDGPKTRAAVKQFQGDNGLTVDGIAGPNTRKKLFAVYMAGKHDVAVDDARFMDPKHMGCGELNPVVETEQPNEENRRVTFFLFNAARLPRIPCKHGDLGPCNKQKNPPLPRFKEEFHCSFYDSITRDCPCEGGGKVVPPVVGAAVKIHHEDGVNAPASGVLVGGLLKLQAVPNPDAAGSFKWTTTSTKIELQDADKRIVSVKGKELSAARAGEELTVSYTGADGKTVTDTVKLTVVNMEVVSNVQPKDMKGVVVPEKPARTTRSQFVPAPLIVGVNYEVELRAFCEPAKATAFEWTLSGLTAVGATNAETLKLKATALSAALDDKEVTVKVTTDQGQFETTHKLTAVRVEIHPVRSNITVKSTDDINKIPNPAGIVILDGAAKEDTKQVPKIEITKIEPDLGWTDDDDRISWWIRGNDKPAGYEGGADFPNRETAKHGKKIEIFGTKQEDVLIQPYSGGFPYGLYRAHVIPLHKVKYRINRIFTTGAGARVPTSSHDDAKKHVKVMNIYLRAAGIEMVPDDSAEIATSAGNKKIGLPTLDSKVVTVTKVSDGHFDVEVNDVALTFNATSSDSVAAIRINARNEVISFAYMHSESSAKALATARLCPVNHAPKPRKDPPRAYTRASYTLEDKGIPSSSLISKTGIPGDTPAGTVKMVVLFPDVSWKPTQTDRHVDLLWGVSVPNTSIDNSSSATGGEATIQAYGNTLAHEMGHILGLGHRNSSGAVWDGLNVPANENLMHPSNPPPRAIDSDIIQVKAIRFSEVLFRSP
jgi:hypothetical protein